MAGHRYWAFISYASADRAAAVWLQTALERYRVPARLVGRETGAGPAPKRLRPVFRDRTELPASADLGARLTQAVAESAFLIVMCSPAAAASRWVEAEVVAFRRSHDVQRILCVLVGDDVEVKARDCFPPSLLSPIGNAAAASLTPIAADLRSGGDGKRLVLLKVVAGAIGVGLDDLVRRDDQRRLRLMAAITTASLAGTAVAGGLATVAVMARDEARDQRAHAETLIEYMLGDLRKRLEPGGQLGLLDGAAAQALAYYRAQDPASLDDRSLGRRARALRMMGEIAVQRGDLGAAMPAFGQAEATTAEVLARAPNDGRRIFDHAQSVYWFGEIARERGQLDKALAVTARYRAMIRRLTILDPGNDDWRTELGYADQAVGADLAQAGRLREALVNLRAALDVDLDLAGRRPGADREVTVAQTRAWIADVLTRQGRLAEAQAQRLTEAAAYRRLLAQDPTMQRARFSIVIATEELAKLDELQGRREGAVEGFAAAAAGAESLLAAQRDNMDQTAVTAHAQAMLGEAFLDLGRVGEAKAAQARAGALIAVALGHDGSVSLWRQYAAEATNLDAGLRAGRGDAAGAAERAGRALAMLTPKPGAPTEMASGVLIRCVRLRLGDALARLGRADEARAQWSAILDGAVAGPDDPRLLLVMKAADERLGRMEGARAIAHRLASMTGGR
jgi:tetratricopeptide (TPR) repeat protein